MMIIEKNGDHNVMSFFGNLKLDLPIKNEDLLNSEKKLWYKIYGGRECNFKNKNKTDKFQRIIAVNGIKVMIFFLIFLRSKGPE